MARPVVDLPHPDSPTRPSVSPGLTWNEMPSTAWTAPTLRWKMIPRVSGKCITRLLTVRSDSPAPLLFAPFAATCGSALCVAAGEALSGLDAAMDRLPLDRVGVEIRRCAGKKRIVRIEHAVSTRYDRLQAIVFITGWRRVAVA